MDEELAAEASRAAPPQKQEDESDTEDEEEETVSVVSRQAKEDVKMSQSEYDVEQSVQSQVVMDFEKRLADADSRIEDVMDEMESTITSKVINSFGSNGYNEAKELIKVMRRVAIEDEVAERYNTFLRKFKALILDESLPRSRSDFWNNLMQGREELSLITDSESVGGNSLNVNERESMAFINE